MAQQQHLGREGIHIGLHEEKIVPRRVWWACEMEGDAHTHVATSEMTMASCLQIGTRHTTSQQAVRLLGCTRPPRTHISDALELCAQTSGPVGRGTAQSPTVQARDAGHGIHSTYCSCPARNTVASRATYFGSIFPNMDSPCWYYGLAWTYQNHPRRLSSYTRSTLMLKASITQQRPATEPYMHARAT